MKKLFMVLPLVILLCFTFGCQQGEEVAEEPVVDIAAETEAMKEVFWAYANDLAKDVELSASTLTDDVITFRGDKETFVEWVKNNRSQGSYVKNHSILKIELSASGDMGYVAFSFDYVREEDGEEEVTGKGYNVIVCMKQADGNWKIAAL
jgi:ketosteroid isomerase-like protein